jgi:hypothetical protein
MRPFMGRERAVRGEPSIRPGAAEGEVDAAERMELLSG